MKKSSAAIVSAIAVACMGFSSLSFAQNYDGRQGPQARPQVQQHSPQHRAAAPQPNRQVHPVDNRFANSDTRRNDRGGYYNARGPEFRRGGHIPSDFRNRQYVVTDYRAYHLNPPPRGQQWVQVGSDYVLVAIATGLIANIILNH